MKEMFNKFTEFGKMLLEDIQKQYSEAFIFGDTDTIVYKIDEYITSLLKCVNSKIELLKNIKINY